MYMYEFKSVKEKLLSVSMRGLYSMQGEAIYKTPWLDPRIGINTSCGFIQARREWVGQSR